MRAAKPAGRSEHMLGGRAGAQRSEHPRPHTHETHGGSTSACTSGDRDCRDYGHYGDNNAGSTDSGHDPGGASARLAVADIGAY